MDTGRGFKMEDTYTPEAAWDIIKGIAVKGVEGSHVLRVEVQVTSTDISARFYTAKSSFLMEFPTPVAPKSSV